MNDGEPVVFGGILAHLGGPVVGTAPTASTSPVTAPVIGFGVGLHQCLGQHVARLEAEALLTALARRVERIELTRTPHRHPNNTLHAWASLPLRVQPAA